MTERTLLGIFERENKKYVKRVKEKIEEIVNSKFKKELKGAKFVYEERDYTKII